MGEVCDRCKSSGEDRRTLMMRCFYAMEELGIPFGREVLLDADPATLTPCREPTGIDLGGGRRLTLQAGTVTCSGELTPEELYTLRVCKRCRGEWMAAIRDWFHATPNGRDHDADEPAPPEVGSGIFVRENGAVREVTREEWDERQRAKGEGR